MVRTALLIFIFTVFSHANIGKVIAYKGDIIAIKDEQSRSLKQNSEIFKNDLIKTSKNAKLQILFKDNTIITIGKNANFKVLDYAFEEKKKIAKAKFSLLKGTFRTITGKIGKIAPKNFKLTTKSASIGIRGTQILVDIQGAKEDIYCTQGQIEVSSLNSSSSAILDAGEYLSLKVGSTNSFKKSTFSSKKIKNIDNDSKFDEESKDEISNEISQLSIASINIQSSSDNANGSNNKEDNSNSSNDTSSVVDLDMISDTALDDKADTVIQRDNIGFISSENFGAKSFKMSGNDLEIYGVSSYVMTFLTFTNQTSNTVTSGNQIDLTYRGIFKSNVGTYDILIDNVNNDDVIWGKWNITNASSLGIANEEGYFIYGNLTSKDEMQDLTSQDKLITYKGDVQGHNQSGVAFATGSISIDINFSKDTVDADFSFDSKTYNISGTDTDISDGYYIEDGDDKMKGDFYGSNARTTAGSFSIKDGASSYTGVYQAGK